jgi:hypothetical protein
MGTCRRDSQCPKPWAKQRKQTRKGDELMGQLAGLERVRMIVEVGWPRATCR